MHFWASAKLKMRKSFILCVGLCRMAEKSEFKNKQKYQKSMKHEKITRVKITTYTVNFFHFCQLWAINRPAQQHRHSWTQ